MPQEVFPYTKHSSHNDNLHVSFQDRHRLVFKRHEAVEHKFDIDAGYQFINPEDVRMFQEGLRDMELLGTFEFDKLWSARKGFLGEATNENLKLWRSHDLPPMLSLSFYASSVEKRHLEFCVPWFEPQITSDKPTNLVRLNFIRGKAGGPENGDQPRRVSMSGIARRFSFGRTSPTSGISHLLRIIIKTETDQPRKCPANPAGEPDLTNLALKPCLRK